MKIIGLALCSTLLAVPLTTKASDVTVIVDGQPVFFEDVQPSIVDGRTMVPLRGVFDMIGFSIDWNSNTSTAILNNYGTTITVTAGDSFIIANDAVHTSDVAPRIQDGRFMLPLSLIAEATGAKVNWDNDTRTVYIITESVFHIENPVIESEDLDPPEQIAPSPDSRPLLFQYELRGVSMEIFHIDQSYVHITVRNNTELVPMVGFDYHLEFFNGSKWVDIPFKEFGAFPLTVRPIEPFGGTWNFMISIVENHYLYESGLYRIRKRIVEASATFPFTHQDYHDLVVEFYWSIIPQPEFEYLDPNNQTASPPDGHSLLFQYELKNVPMEVIHIGQSYVYVTVRNNTEHIPMLGFGYHLEFFNGTNWIDIPLRAYIEFPSLTRPIEPFGSQNFTKNIATNHYLYESGLYRIRKRIVGANAIFPFTYQNYHDLVAEFYREVNPIIGVRRLDPIE